MKASNLMQRKMDKIAQRFRVDLSIVGTQIKIVSGAYMPLTIEVVGEGMIAVHHTYTHRSGDLLFDPEIVFWRAHDGKWYAVESTGMRGGFGYERVVFDVDAQAGTWGRWKPRAQRDLATFANTWATQLARQEFTTVNEAEIIDPRKSRERVTRRALRIVKSRGKVRVRSA